MKELTKDDFEAWVKLIRMSVESLDGVYRIDVKISGKDEQGMYGELCVSSDMVVSYDDKVIEDARKERITSMTPINMTYPASFPVDGFSAGGTKYIFKKKDD